MNNRQSLRESVYKSFPALIIIARDVKVLTHPFHDCLFTRNGFAVAPVVLLHVIDELAVVASADEFPAQRWIIPAAIGN